MRIIYPLALGLFALCFVPACDNRDMPVPDGGGSSCILDLDCDDGFPCTLETCGVGGVCQYTPLDARCDAGESCVVGRGCVSGTSCTSSADCDDSVGCTVDSCGVGGTCRHMALDELCTEAALPVCDATMGCVRGSGCLSAADCDDEIDCTIDSCGADTTCRHTPMDALCEDGETCNALTGCFASMACETADDCDDGDFCNGTETCDAKFGCMPGAPPPCNDSESCTVDRCDSTLGLCVFECDRTSSDPRCMAMPGCAVTGPTCDGVFQLASTTTIAACAFGDVQPTVSRLIFEWDGFDMTISNQDSTLVLADSTAPTCPAVEATYTLSGMCDEVFTLSGSFSDDDTFDGAISARYTGSGCAFLCPGPYSTTIHATRM